MVSENSESDPKSFDELLIPTIGSGSQACITEY